MRYLLTLTILMCAPLVQAEEHPEWGSLRKLFGQKTDSKDTSALVRKYHLKEITKGPSGSYSSSDQAYSLLYREGKIDTIVLSVSEPVQGYPEPHWKSYAQPLPGNLLPQDGRAQVVEKLGQPTKPNGDRWIQHGLVFWVFFNEDETRIVELYLSVQEKPAKPRSP